MKKRLLYSLHKWCGLVTAAFLLLQSVTGLSLVYQWDVARLLDSSGMVRQTQGASAPLTSIAQSLSQQLPGYRLQRLVFPDTQGATYFAHLLDSDGNTRYASVDPGSASVLREGGIWSFPMHAAVRIHFNLMAGTTGLFVVCLIGATAVGLVVTGVQVWWPRRWRRGHIFRIHWSAPFKLVLRQLHKTVGALFAPLLLLMVFTGALLAWEPLLSGADLSTGSASDISLTAPEKLEQAVFRAKSAFPDNDIYDVRLPGAGSIYVLLRAPDTGPQAVHIVQISTADLSIEHITRAGTDPNLAYYLLPLHSGEQFGSAGRVAVILGGAMLLGLTLSGPVMWLQRTYRAPGSR